MRNKTRQADRYFYIISPYYSAGLKYNWGNNEEEKKANWGIGLNKERIDKIALENRVAVISYGGSKQEYTLSAREIQKYPVENVKDTKTQLYIIPRSILNYKKSEEAKAKELSELVL